MKFKTQLILHTVLIVGLFSISFGLFILEFKKLTVLQNLTTQALSLTAKGKDLENRTISILTERNQLQTLRDQWDESKSSFDRGVKELLESAEDLPLNDKLRSSFSSLQNAYGMGNTFLPPIENGTDAIISNRPLLDKIGYSGLFRFFVKGQAEGNPEWEEILYTLEDAVKEASQWSSTINGSLNNLSENIRLHSEEKASKTLMQILLQMIIITVVSISYIIYISNKMTKSMEILEETMNSLSQRDLSVQAQLKGNKEITNLGNHINIVAASLSSFIREVHQVSNQTLTLKESLASGTAESLAALQQISRNIDGLELSIETLDTDTSAAEESISSISDRIEQLNKNIQRQFSLFESNLTAIQKISSSVGEVSTLTDRGKARSEELINSLQSGGKKVEATHNIIEKVAINIKSIKEVTGIINDISDQTGILSINAAIESAHAGTAGKGFSVVAEEIRSLAVSTSQNAEQIDKTLKFVTDQIEEALSASTEGFDAVRLISQGLDELSSALVEINRRMDELSYSSREITQSSEQLNSITGDISGASGAITQNTRNIMESVKTIKGISGNAADNIKEIGLGSREITKSMQDVHSVSEENSIGVEKLAEMIESFKIQSEETEPSPEEEKDAVERGKA